MRTVEIPGGTAQVRDQPGEITIGAEQLIAAASAAAMPAFRKVLDREKWVTDGSGDVRSTALTMEDSLSLFQRTNAMVVARLASWTIDRPLPTIHTIGDLPSDLHAPLAKAVQDIELEGIQVTDFGPSPEEESPTEGSDGSEPASKVSRSAKSRATARS